MALLSVARMDTHSVVY
jgi:hypothetical protein